jgi:hypothetical protein
MPSATVSGSRLPFWARARSRAMVRPSPKAPRFAALRAAETRSNRRSASSGVGASASSIDAQDGPALVHSGLDADRPRLRHVSERCSGGR